MGNKVYKGFGFEFHPQRPIAIYNALKPLFEQVASPVGVATLGAGTELHALSKTYTAAKAALFSMSGIFTALMAKGTIDANTNRRAVMADPNSTDQDKDNAVAQEVVGGATTLLGALGTVESVSPEVLPKLQGKTPTEAVQVLKQESAASPPEQAEHLDNAANEISKIANPKFDEAKQAWDEVKKVFAPASRGPQAEATAGSLREMGGERARRADIAEEALKDSRKTLMKLPVNDRWAAVDKIEAGEPLADPKLQMFADTTREILDTKRKEIQALGTGKLEHFIEDYFPHLWKDPEEAEDIFKRAAIAKAPLQGSKSFLKQRTIPTIQEGRALGLEPATEDPVEMVLLKAREMDKYITAQKHAQEMISRGFWKYVPAGEKPEPGIEKINDSIATVYGPRSGAVSFSPDVNTLTVTPQDVNVHGQRIMGSYYAPSEVAAVANNYLSPGLRKYALYRGYMGLSNSVNQFQLGLSAFHLGFTTLDTSISKLALALEQGEQGVRELSPVKVAKAVGEAAKVPAAPFRAFIQGNKVLKEWSKPGSQGGDIADIADAYMKGGGRAKQDQIYASEITKKMVDAFRKGGVGGTASGIWRVPFAALEQVSKPLMTYVVPRLKAGVASDMIRFELEKLPKNATEDQQRAVFDKVVDSVDNRLGQMTYDNLFWNKTLKDLSMATVRSVGWDLGTLREVGGGIVDTAKYLKNSLTPAETAKFTHRMGYTIALPTLTGILGATYMYLRTGQPPQELRDYFFPKTGQKDPQGRDVRMSFPTYMKDVYHYADRPVQTLEGKVSPLPALVWEMLNNKDYFGRDIRNADDPLVKQMMDEAKYFASAYTPIVGRNIGTASAAGESKGEQAAAFFGVTRAPAWIGETAAEQLAGQLAGDKFKSSTSPDTALVAKKQKIMTDLRNGTDEEKDAARERLDAMQDAGEISGRQQQNLLRGIDHAYLENALTHLDAKEAMRVFKLATPKERELIVDELDKKIHRAHLPLADKEALLDEMNKLQGARNTFSLRQP
jgi:hypothetical protein